MHLHWCRLGNLYAQVSVGDECAVQENMHSFLVSFIPATLIR